MKIGRGIFYALAAIGWFMTAYDHEPSWLVTLGLIMTGVSCFVVAVEAFFPWLREDQTPFNS